jgi:primosomal protein N' (replication factor Y) (superfamily II helicase)
MQALKAQDRDAFVAAEMAEREIMKLPPFGRLGAVVLSGPDAQQLEAFARAMAEVAPNADAPLSLVRGRRRKRFLVRADRNVDLSAYLAAWRARVKPPGAVRVAIDVDPYSFL